MKSVGMQYLEAIRGLKAQGFVPTRTIHVTFVPGSYPHFGYCQLFS
jgi:aminoacylase